MSALWQLVYGIAALEFMFTLALMVPCPLNIARMVYPLLGRLRSAFLTLSVLFSALMYTSYYGFTEKHPRVHLEEAKTVEAYSFMMQQYFREQRNFYLAAFGLVLSLVIIRLVSVLSKNVKLKSELKELKSQ
eukprot:gb/GECH01012632.1/.p1 GENE.gb/GECH01012632.1/~~gb/GECH01012632.1/.p1  ORF type:complete len:132 (+),score=26.42 gb/GECH01012632.1/:1-396(+)